MNCTGTRSDCGKNEMLRGKFREIEAIGEPYYDLKKRQIELMSKWSTNPNNVTSIRRAINPE